MAYQRCFASAIKVLFPIATSSVLGMKAHDSHSDQTATQKSLPTSAGVSRPFVKGAAFWAMQYFIHPGSSFRS